LAPAFVCVAGWLADPKVNRSVVPSICPLVVGTARIAVQLVSAGFTCTARARIVPAGALVGVGEGPAVGVGDGPGVLVGPGGWGVLVAPPGPPSHPTPQVASLEHHDWQWLLSQIVSLTKRWQALHPPLPHKKSPSTSPQPSPWQYPVTHVCS